MLGEKRIVYKDLQSSDPYDSATESEHNKFLVNDTPD